MRGDIRRVAIYTYDAIVRRGQRQQGRVEAEHRDDAIRQLSKIGLHVVELQEVKSSIWTKEISFTQRTVKLVDFVAFARQFATLVRAGLPLVDALQVLVAQTRSKPLQAALSDVVQRVIEGNSLSDSFSHHPRVFPSLFVHMTHAGEVSGTLDEVLESTATLIEKQYQTTEKIKSAMIYPISVGVFSVLVTVFLLVKVLPMFVSEFQQEKLTLPLPTRIVLGVSHFLTHQWYVCPALLVLAVGTCLWMVRSPRALYLRDKWLLRVPVFGSLLQKDSVARLCRTLSLLFRSAVPTLQAMGITADVVQNRYIANTLRESREQLRAGESMVGPFEASDAFPPMVTQMIHVGERTGNLDEMLSKVADFYEAEVATMVDRLKQLMEPVMIAILAVVVGSIVLAAILPMFSLYQGLN